MSHGPNIFRAEQGAQRLLREHGIRTLPVDPWALAEKLGIAMREVSGGTDGPLAILIRHGESCGIIYRGDPLPLTLQRFSVAHEVGHYVLPGHVDRVTGGKAPPCAFLSGATDPHEREAERFAAALLMPSDQFQRKLRSAGDGFTAIERLARDFGTSLEATALRVAQLAGYPLAVVRLTSGEVDYCFQSRACGDYRPRLDLPRGTRIDPELVSAQGPGPIESNLDQWFAEAPKDATIRAEARGLGPSGKVLVLLTEIPDWADFEEDEEEGVSGWKDPSF